MFGHHLKKAPKQYIKNSWKYTKKDAPTACAISWFCAFGTLSAQTITLILVAYLADKNDLISDIKKLHDKPYDLLSIDPQTQSIIALTGTIGFQILSTVYCCCQISSCFSGARFIMSFLKWLKQPIKNSLEDMIQHAADLTEKVLLLAQTDKTKVEEKANELFGEFILTEQGTENADPVAQAKAQFSKHFIPMKKKMLAKINKQYGEGEKIAFAQDDPYNKTTLVNFLSTYSDKVNQAIEETHRKYSEATHDLHTKITEALHIIDPKKYPLVIEGIGPLATRRDATGYTI